MKEDESKNPKTATEQPDNAQSVETVETPDTTADADAKAGKPDETPSDGEGCEAVTVVIIARDEKHGELAARSVQACLLGVDADIHVLTDKDVKNTDAKTLLAHLPHVKTERIVLMGEGMVILNPVTLHDIAVPKAHIVKGVAAYGHVKAPAMYYRSVLATLLPQLADEKPYASLPDEYFPRVYPGLTPINSGDDFREEPFVLPVVSKNPPLEALQKYGEWKKFAWISPLSWTDTVVKFLEDRFHV